MSLPFFIVVIMLVVMFFIVPQFAKFRATLGINEALQSKGLTLLQKTGLSLLGLKTPFLNTVALMWSFILAEGDKLMGFSWEQIVSHEHAVWIATSLWFVTLWSHFSGLNTAAASPPVISPLPAAIPVPKG